jgi:hypothetical protein
VYISNLSAAKFAGKNSGKKRKKSKSIHHGPGEIALDL